MRKYFFLFLLLFSSLHLNALVLRDGGELAAKRNVVADSYNFWIYTPEKYFNEGIPMPLIIFLHGASLCGNKMNRVRRYGVLDAIQRGTSVPAMVVAPQNSGGAWNPKKLNKLLEWMIENYPVDSNRVYVLGMSLGGYGTMDFVGTYPDKIAAALAICGGTTLADLSGLGELPLWIVHGTADRDVRLSESKRVVDYLQKLGKDKLLSFDWVKGWNHGRPVRLFYKQQTYDWLLSHSLDDQPRRLNKTFPITRNTR